MYVVSSDRTLRCIFESRRILSIYLFENDFQKLIKIVNFYFSRVRFPKNVCVESSKDKKQACVKAISNSCVILTSCQKGRQSLTCRLETSAV